ncbi:hypothetical protein QJS10_CPA05g01148 [Acorus calamus]|uniref:Uncharacterized protein n=1 Tax=Acorus calamus TaxID=4465 RepID=A0AAV9ESM5_ACOCL|nr:hypothetical protein QJS10_CPA05g01148 [Acorus calamus]
MQQKNLQAWENQNHFVFLSKTNLPKNLFQKIATSTEMARSKQTARKAQRRQMGLREIQKYEKSM